MTPRPCATNGCKNDAIPSGKWCHDCTTIVWHTGRPPVLVPEPRRPRWTPKDLTGMAA